MLFNLKSLTCAAAVMLGTATFAAEDSKVFAAGFVKDVGASERINYSGRLRMLSQRIPAAACYAHAGIEIEKSTELLVSATQEFDLILKGLEFGEDSLGIIGAEQDRMVLTDIALLKDVWDPLHVDIQHVVDNGGSDTDVVHLARDSREVLKIAQHLVSVLVGEYADPTSLLQADALTMDIAGRQRTLAQRISKNVCLINSGLELEGARKQLADDRKIYQASANALRFGMPSAGITATTQQDILDGLDDVLALWADVQPTLDSVSAGQEITEIQKTEIYNVMNSLTGQMNTLVGKYSAASKLDL